MRDEECCLKLSSYEDLDSKLNMEEMEEKKSYDFSFYPCL